MKIAILDDYQNAALKCADWSSIEKKAQLTVFPKQFRTQDEMIAQLQPFEVLCLMRERSAFPKETIEKLKNVKLIAFTGIKNRNLDQAAAAERGIIVKATDNDPYPWATKELVWALILAASRRLPIADRIMHAGGWLEGVPLGNVLGGRTLGIVGLGKVGKQIAAIAKAFDMNVIAWSPNLTRQRAAEAGATLVTREELFATADVVTIHLVLSDRTTGLIGARDLSAMKKSAIFVNCARGAIVDENALLDILRNKRIAGAALDVYSEEPLPADHPIRKLDNVILTPHLGYVTEEVYGGYYQSIVEIVQAYLDGRLK